MHAEQPVHGVVLMRDLPRFTPAQWQRLFWDAGLRKATLHLDERKPRPGERRSWSLGVETPGGQVELQGIAAPLPPEALRGIGGRDSLLRSARIHVARVEIGAPPDRCPAQFAHEAVARAAATVLRTTSALAWLHPPTSILLAASGCAARIRGMVPGLFPLELFASVRTLPRPPTVVVDTLGLAQAALPDLEIEVDADEVEQARRFLAELARQSLARSVCLDEPMIVPGPLDLDWRVSRRCSAAAPDREVLRFGLAG